MLPHATAVPCLPQAAPMATAVAMPQGCGLGHAVPVAEPVVPTAQPEVPMGLPV